MPRPCSVKLVSQCISERVNVLTLVVVVVAGGLMQEQKVETVALADLAIALNNAALGSVRLISSCTATTAVGSGSGMAVFATIVGSASRFSHLL